MVRPRWKSNTCETCRKRKVKCNGALPTCDTCHRSGRQCVPARTEGGMMIYTPGLSRPRDRNISLQLRPPANISQTEGDLPSPEMFHAFMREYLPVESNLERFDSDDMTSLSWLESLPRNSRRGPLLNMALESLISSFIGRQKGSIELEEWGHAYFMCASKRLSHTTELVDGLGAATVLAIYQLYNCQRGQVEPWMIHGQVAWKLLEEQGPDMPIDRGLLCRIRTFALYDACGRRESTYLSRPEWRRRAPKTKPYESLLDIMLDVPTIQELSDNIIFGNCSYHELQYLRCAFIDQFIETESRLQQWYISFLHNQEENPFPSYQAQGINFGLLYSYPELIGLFRKVIHFPNRQKAQLLLMAWAGFLIIYEEVSKVMRKLNFTLERNETILPRSYGKPRTWFIQEYNLICQRWDPLHNGPRTYQDFEKVAGQFANRICESVALCDKGTHGLAMRQPLLPALWATTQFFKERSAPRYHWCKVVLEDLARKGMVYASGMAAHTYEGYSEASSNLNLSSHYLRQKSISPT